MDTKAFIERAKRIISTMNMDRNLWELMNKSHLCLNVLTIDGCISLFEGLDDTKLKEVADTLYAEVSVMEEQARSHASEVSGLVQDFFLDVREKENEIK